MHKAQGLEYEVHGDGDAVLLIHGALIADAMLPLTRAQSLAGTYRLIRYRRRGYCGSDPVPEGFRIEGQAEDAQALLRHLGVDRTHVIGHSGGGAIGLQLALQAPDLVHSLALLEPAIIPPEIVPLFTESAAPVLEAHHAGDARRAVDLWMKMVSVGENWQTLVAKTVPGGVEQAEADASTFFDVELRAHVDWVFDRDRGSRITQPVLYVLGAESGPLMEAGKDRFLSAVPRAQLVVIPGVNHSMQVGSPDRVAAPVAEFLSRHPL